jgi:HD-GYP domain-containing protein (c-di-GMP phosphodiesterase class II)
VKEEKEHLFEDTFKIAEDVMYQNKLASSTVFKKKVINALLERLFSRDSTSEEHSNLVGSYCAAFARELRYPEDEIEEMRLAGHYHDLGKIAIEPSILIKSTDQLTKSEALELRRHAEIGYNILRSVGEYASFAEAVLYHHERYDGNGYPQGLKRDEIPQQAQILAIANTYADLTGPNFESKQYSESEAKAFLRRKANTTFNPELVEFFITKVLDKMES